VWSGQNPQSMTSCVRPRKSVGSGGSGVDHPHPRFAWIDAFVGYESVDTPPVEHARHLVGYGALVGKMAQEDAAAASRPRFGFWTVIRWSVEIVVQDSLELISLADTSVNREPIEDEADGTLQKRADEAEPVYRRGGASRQHWRPSSNPPDSVPVEHREKPEVMNGVHSNTAGLHRWLSTHPSGAARAPRAREAEGLPTRQAWRSAMEAFSVP
jgi:hypothetical protein